MTFKRIFTAALVLILAGVFSCVYAEATSSAKIEARAMVIKAEKFVKTNGKAKALAEFNKQDGQFVKGSFYVFVYDLKGTVIANPFHPDQLGKSMINEPDSRGKFFRKEIVRTAKAKGQGWVKYMQVNPTTKKEEIKTTYFKKVGDIIIGCGAY